MGTGTGTGLSQLGANTLERGAGVAIMLAPSWRQLGANYPPPLPWRTWRILSALAWRLATTLAALGWYSAQSWTT